MAAFVSDYWCHDLTATSNITVNFREPVTTNYVIYAEVKVHRPKFMWEGRQFADEKSMRLYKNELHSRSCWIVPARIDPYLQQEGRLAVCQIRRSVVSRKQVQCNKRRLYLQRLRKA